MKRITATVLFLTALSAPALAETPTDREMHSWGYVQQVAYPPAAAEAPAMEHHEQRPYYHHEEHKGMKHHGKKHHEGKKAHHAGKHHHHHHKDGKAKEAPAAKETPKQ